MKDSIYSISIDKEERNAFMTFLKEKKRAWIKRYVGGMDAHNQSKKILNNSSANHVIYLLSLKMLTILLTKEVN